jgi:hypothetical protein
MTAPIDCLMEAKAAADVVRGELVKAIRKCPGPWGPEIEGLLKADDAAREGLAVALRSYDAIPEVDFTKPFATPPARCSHGLKIFPTSFWECRDCEAEDRAK